MMYCWFVPLMIVWLSVQLGAGEVDFRRDVRPLLADRCLRCHGPDVETREAGLRLDQLEGATQELDSGMRAVVPGQLETSELIARITSDDASTRMPPVDSGLELDVDEIAILKRWITEGAKYAEHWSTVPVSRPQLPRLEAGSIQAAGWAKATPIDRFVQSKLAAMELTPNPSASRETLIRRVSLALIGLPPTPEEIDDFLANEAPYAYEQMVDRLLASPRFGERWALVWLDIARYADSAGYAQDPERVIWRYRDWVIDAYNRGIPFDQFTVEQLAGDLLPNPTTEQLLATAFHRNTMTNSEGGTDDEEFRNAAVVDRVNTTMEVWMGLTLACAQCHDHKYDNITQREYFQFFAVFNNTEDADRGDESPWIEELTASQQMARQSLQSQLDALPSVEAEPSEQRKKLMAELAAIQGIKTPILRELPSDALRESFIHVRGNFRVRGESVEPNVPSMFPSLTGPASRLSVSRWLVSRENPLTARVAVNRFWELLFGRGLVLTSEDFGTQGELPTHPELLDYLAWELMAHDWDMKWLLKEIVTSATYQQSSKLRPETVARDDTNQWLSRGPRFRLSAEIIRDQAMAAAGLLSTRMHGPSVRPPRPKLGLNSAFGGSTDWEPSDGEDRYRRGLYTSWRRTTPYPSMATFDAPSREFCTVRRIRTNTPLQALVTLNDPVFVEAAQGLARRVLEITNGSFEEQLQLAFRLVVARDPQSAEVERMRALHRDVGNRYREDQGAAAQMASSLSVDQTALPNKQTAPETMIQLATWTVLCNVLLNLDEALAPL